MEKLERELVQHNAPWLSQNWAGHGKSQGLLRMTTWHGYSCGARVEAQLWSNNNGLVTARLHTVTTPGRGSRMTLPQIKTLYDGGCWQEVVTKLGTEGPDPKVDKTKTMAARLAYQQQCLSVHSRQARSNIMQRKEAKV